MNKTSISWCIGTDGKPGFSWNPFAGCSPVSAGCKHCYAKRLLATRLAHLPQYAGLAHVDDSEDTDHERVIDRYRWSGEVRFFPEKLVEPLRRRKPSGIFVGDMGDIGLLPDEQIGAIFGVMTACPQHRFYILTKRPGRMREWFEWLGGRAQACESMFPFDTLEWRRIHVLRSCALRISGNPMPSYDEMLRTGWPLPNVWVGTSVCTREDLANIDQLRKIPAEVRFVSFEPLLEDLGTVDLDGIQWAIAGGESGPRARPCHVEWLRSIVCQCADAWVACWVKQYGANAVGDGYDLSDKDARELDAAGCDTLHEQARLSLRDRAGADPSEWPADLRVREQPTGRERL